MGLGLAGCQVVVDTPLWVLVLTDLLCQNAQQTEDFVRKWYRQSRCHLTKDLVGTGGGLVGGMASMSAVILSPALITVPAQIITQINTQLIWSQI